MQPATSMTARMAAALRRWEEEDWPSVASWCRACGFSSASLYCWRKYPPFEERFNKRRLGMIQAAGGLKASRVVAPEVETPSGDAMERFLEAYRRLGSRIDAAQEAGIEWEAVEAVLSTNKLLSERFERLRRREEMRIEDALRRKAADGDSAALNTLSRQNLLKLGSGNPAGKGSGASAVDEDLSRHYRERLKLIQLEN